MSMEKSEAVFKELESKFSNTKALTSLNNVKAACDLIVVAKGQMNYSTAARIATENYGGPVKSTVQNNNDLKRYIAARIDEYCCVEKDFKLPEKIQIGNKKTSYPVNNLDVRTKVHIDILTSRNEMLETRYKDLKLELERLTKSNPINLSEAIGRGPARDGSSALQIEYTQLDTHDLHSFRAALENILQLPEIVSNLEVEVRDEKKRMVLKRTASNEVILDPKQYEIIERYISDRLAR